MKVTRLQTPNVSKQSIKPSGIVLHHTAGFYKGSVAWCMDTKSEVSYHYIVDITGNYTQLAIDTQRVWANGKSSFKGKNDCNSFMISIAVSGDTNKRRLLEAEIQTVALLCIEKMSIFGFGLDSITTHREISPGRKNDVDSRAKNEIIQRIKQIQNGL
jgi:N-acetyl-anhydromuramyl-L-alanine amidase AmpD